MENKHPGNPLVSIVIPTYNTGNYLLEAIASVHQQTYRPIELIIVDDGSTDDTPQKLAVLAGEFTHYRQDNSGQSSAMNFGWHRSSGEYLGYLSADDRLHPDAIERLVEAMIATPDAVLAYPDFHVIDEHSNHVRVITTPEYSEELLIANFQCIPGPGAIFRRTAWRACGDWDVSLRNIPDMDFFLRLCQFGSFLRVGSSLADFRIHSGSTTYNASSAERSDEPVRVIDNFFNTASLPSSIRHWKKRSTANAYMLSGFMHGFSGRYSKFFIMTLKALMLFPRAVISRKMLSYVIAILKSKN
jgi:glycosyltransferase involved in cell wall biosynthesis